jgi:tryptophan synthase alpha chain
MASKIALAMQQARQEDRSLLVVYLCAGDPSLEHTEKLVVALAEAGADIIELGVPFSDPTADGVVIQQASERALRHGASMKTVLQVVSKVRKHTQVPILLFGYYNPILAYGEQALVADAANAGVDGFLVVDLPPESSSDFRRLLQARELDFVPLVAPTTTDARLRQVAEAASSFVYYVSVTGVTGASDANFPQVRARAHAVREKLGKPLVVGFGIKTAEDVRQLRGGADGVVIGSALVKLVHEAHLAGDDCVDRAARFVRALAVATRVPAAGHHVQRQEES